MFIKDIPFSVTSWEKIPVTEHLGIKGKAYWKTQQFGEIRVRMVEYSENYEADHWCKKGHILLCLEGSIETELSDGRRFQLTPGVSYQVGDNDKAHKSISRHGAKLFIVD